MNEEEVSWAGFLVDEDAKGCAELLDDAVFATAHDDPDIVEEAWFHRRTIVTCNRRHFLTHIRRFQSRENQKECRDLWGLLVVNNLRLLREEGLPLVRTGLRVLPKQEPLRWAGAGFLNLYVRLRVEKPWVAKSRHAEIKGVNVMSPALP